MMSFLLHERFLSAVLALCIAFRFSVTSWIRTPKRNVEVGGSMRSNHLMGLAVDIVIESPDIDGFILFAKRLGLKVIKERDHYHLELDEMD